MTNNNFDGSLSTLLTKNGTLSNMRQPLNIAAMLIRVNLPDEFLVPSELAQSYLQLTYKEGDVHDHVLCTSLILKAVFFLCFHLNR